MSDIMKERAADSSSMDKLVLNVLALRPAGATGLQKLALTVLSVVEGKLPSGFAAYHFGAFDDEITETLDDLRAEGFVELVNGRTYRLTPSGRVLVEQKLNDPEARRVQHVSQEVVPALRHLSDEEVVSVVYSLFPELARNSQIRHRVDTQPKKIKNVEVLEIPHQT